MHLRRLLSLPSILLCTLALAIGCSSSYQIDLLRAEQFERAGSYREALAVYENALPRIPSAYRRQLASAHLHAGGCDLKLQRFKEAFEHYQKAVDVDSTNSDAHLRLAELLVAGGFPQQALTHVEFVLDRQPENSAALGLLGTIAAAAGRNQQAIQLFEHSLKNDPSLEQTAIALAELYNREGKVADARAVLLRSASANPKSPLASLALARLEEQEGNSKAAESAYRAARQANDSVVTNLRLAQFLQRAVRMSEAEQVLRHIDSLRPDSPTAVADFQLASGRPESALQDYSEAINRSLHVANTAMSKTNRASSESPAAVLASRLVEAELHASPLSGEMQVPSGDKSSQTAAAHALLDKYRQLLDEATIAVLESEIALAEGDVPKAEMQATIAATRAPESAPAHYVRGLVYKLQDKVAEAKEEWNTALLSDPDHVPSLLALAHESLTEGDTATADKQISAVVRNEPGNVAALNLYARVLLAAGRFNSARGILSRALALDGKALEPQVTLGEIEMAQHRWGAALIEYQKALITHPDSADALHGLLNVYRQGAITRSVLLQMEKVANAPPSSASLMEIAGRLYAEHGWRTDAIRALRRAVEINPQRVTAALALTNAYLAHGDPDSAKQTVLASRSIEAVTPGATAMLAAAQAQARGNDSAAIRGYEAAIRQGESSGTAANNLAWIYAQHGTKLDRALRLSLSAVERNPKDAAMLDTLGVVYLKLRNYSAATETLRKAVRLTESMKSLSDSAMSQKAHAELYQHLATAYTGVGLIGEAAAALSKAR